MFLSITNFIANAFCIGSLQIGYRYGETNQSSFNNLWCEYCKTLFHKVSQRFGSSHKGNWWHLQDYGNNTPTSSCIETTWLIPIFPLFEMKAKVASWAYHLQKCVINECVSNLINSLIWLIFRLDTSGQLINNWSWKRKSFNFCGCKQDWKRQQLSYCWCCHGRFLTWSWW